MDSFILSVCHSIHPSAGRLNRTTCVGAGLQLQSVCNVYDLHASILICSARSEKLVMKDHVNLLVKCFGKNIRLILETVRKNECNLVMQLKICLSLFLFCILPIDCLRFYDKGGGVTQCRLQFLT